MKQKPASTYIINGFLTGFALSLIGITVEDVLHQLPISVVLSKFHHYLAPVILGCLSGLLGYILWKRKKMQIGVLNSYSKNLHALLDVNSALISTIDLDSVLQIIIDEATQLADLDTGAIYLNEQERLYLGATTPPLPDDFPEILRTDLLINHPHIRKSLDQKQPVVIPETGNAILSEAEMTAVKVRGLRSVIYIPLIIENRAVGSLILGTTHHQKSFTENEINTYRTFSGQAALAIENARLFKETMQISEELRQQNENFIRLNEELGESNRNIKKINEELLISKGKAEESDRLKSTFLANMSHEIRTPLNSILGFSELLGDPETDMDLREKYNQIIQDSGDQLLRIISDILDLSKIETGQIVISSSPFQPYRILQGVVEELSIHAKNKNIDFNYESISEGDGHTIISDQIRVKQILTNLVSNAIKFTDEGSVKVGYNVLAAATEFYVRDTGCGISEENLDKIFDRFHQIENLAKRKIEGNGLGLAISKSLAEKLGGHIRVESEMGKGSTFYFSVPVM